MTPPAATHTAPSSGFSAKLEPGHAIASLSARLLAGPNWRRLRLLLDVVVTYLAALAALFAASPLRVTTGERWLAAAFPLLVLALIYGHYSPDDRLTGGRLGTLTHVIGVVSLSAMLTIAADSVVGGSHPVALALRLWVFAAVYLGIARVMLLSLRRYVVQLDDYATPTLIVGAGRMGEHIARRLRAQPGYGLRPVGFLDSETLGRWPDQAETSVPILGGIDDLHATIEQTGARRVILAFTADRDHILVDKVRECEERGIEVSLVPRLYETINERATLDHLGGIPLVSLRHTDPHGWQFAVKHALDRTFAALALVALSPMMLAIALLVRFTSPGPVLFRQRRIGRDGREFDLLKFRTMRMPSLEEVFVPLDGCGPGGVEGVDRRTSIGRFLRSASLDELPQFLNVLRGEMSVVGPRPERPQYVQRFSTEVDRYDERHRVKSGLTGWAQVHGLRGQTSIVDRVEWDNYYIQNWSLRLDFRIMVLTVLELLRFRG